MRDPKMLWRFLWIPTLAMSLGWGLRGVMGHARGAMIPGAIMALVTICLLPRKHFSHSLLAGLGAVAYGFAATMTTQDTADIALSWVHHPAPLVLKAFAGLALKGAIWAAYGGIYLGLGAVADRYRRMDIAIAMVLMVAAFPVGWTLINKPSPLYFGITRYESFGGFIFCIVALVAWLTLRGDTRVPLILGAYAACGGAIGLPAGAAVGHLGIHTLHTGPWYDWWKSLELTFGAFMGLGLGLGLYQIRDRLPDALPQQEAPSQTLPVWASALTGLGLCVIFQYWPEDQLGEWIVLGSVLTCAVFFYRMFGWQLAITVTLYSTCLNVADYWVEEQKIFTSWHLHTAVWVITAATAWFVGAQAQGTFRTARRFLCLLLWGIVLLCGLKDEITHPVLFPAAGAVAAAGNRLWYSIRSCSGGTADQVIFVLLAAVLTAAIIRTSRRPRAFIRHSEDGAYGEQPVP